MDCVWICLHAHKKAKTYSTKIIHNVKERHKLTNRYHDNFSVWFIVLKSLFWPKKKSLCDILSPWLCFIYLWDSFRHDSWSKKKSLSYCFFLNLYSIEYWRVVNMIFVGSIDPYPYTIFFIFCSTQKLDDQYSSGVLHVSKSLLCCPTFPLSTMFLLDYVYAKVNMFTFTYPFYVF